MTGEGEAAAAAPTEGEPPPPIQPPPIQPPPEQPPPEQPAPEAAPASRPAGRGGRRLGDTFWLSLMLALVLVLIGASPYWAPAVIPLLPWYGALGGPAAGSPAQGPSAAELSQRIAALEQKLGQASQPPARAADTAAIAGQQAALKVLSDRVVALEQRSLAAGADNTAALASLEGQMDKLDQANRQLAAALGEAGQRLGRLEQVRGERAESADRLLLIALAELRNAVEHSGPYSSELATVEALAHDRPEIAARLKPLEADAALGVPSLAVLTRSFAESAVPAILRAAASEVPPSASWSDRLWARLRALVLIRRLDPGAGLAESVDRTIATAESALDKGDLAGAVTAVEGLTGAPATAASAWLAQARRRLAAQTLLAHLAQDVAAGSNATTVVPSAVPDGQPIQPPATEPPADQTPAPRPLPAAPDAIN